MNPTRNTIRPTKKKFIYKPSGLHPDLQTQEDDGITVEFLNGAVDIAPAGDYFYNSGQIISAPDALDMATALNSSVQAGEWGKNSRYIQTLITLLKGGSAG